jgi:hypothetical protein
MPKHANGQAFVRTKDTPIVHAHTTLGSAQRIKEGISEIEPLGRFIE